MKKVANILRSHKSLIINWFKAKGLLSSGAVEGVNNMIIIVIAYIRRFKLLIYNIKWVGHTYEYIFGYIRKSEERRNKVDKIISKISNCNIVVIHPFAISGINNIHTRKVTHNLVKDFHDVYGSILPMKLKTKIHNNIGDIIILEPLGILRIPAHHDNYLKEVGDKTRNMIKKSIKLGYVFNKFHWDDHLDELYHINTSKEYRQGEKMKFSYSKKVEPLQTIGEEYLCYGAFKKVDYGLIFMWFYAESYVFFDVL